MIKFSETIPMVKPTRITPFKATQEDDQTKEGE